MKNKVYIGIDPDVDASGVSRIDGNGIETKKFTVQDGAGILLNARGTRVMMDPVLEAEIVSEAVEALRPEMLHDNTWYADYVRLRMRAIKKA